VSASFDGGSGGSGVVILDAGRIAASTTGSPTLSRNNLHFHRFRNNNLLGENIWHITQN
jgi:hypothetical protein